MKRTLARFFTHYGMVGVLVLLCLYYSWATYTEQEARGDAAAPVLAAQIARDVARPASVFIVARTTDEDARFAGVVMASQLKSGSPTYGLSYELYVIAAVVVGGTSLSGGEGRIFGTLIGALIIGVIQNGMNLTGVESYTQKVVLGLVILGAVLLDMWKRRGWGGLGRLFRRVRV